MRLLHIDSSILGVQSVSRQLTARIVASWVSAHPHTQVEYLDLARHAPSHLSAESLGSRSPAAASVLTEVQLHEQAISETLVSQFLAADVVVIGAPLYNFSIPSQLKAWIDRVAQPGRTFKYTEAGPLGLAGGKTVIVASTRGGVYSNSDGGRAIEHQESYLKTVFEFLGIRDLRFVRAEGLALGEPTRSKAIADADIVIRSMATEAANERRVMQAA